jgi:hypothetical protein
MLRVSEPERKPAVFANAQKSLLTVLNDEHVELTGKKFYMGRSWNTVYRQWSYRFADGGSRATYVGALLYMRQRMAYVLRA